MNSELSTRRYRALFLISLAELLAMSVWFSASAIVPALEAEWQISSAEAAWLTLAVQLGFVAGTLTSALLNLPDVFSVRRLFALSAVAASGVNAAIALAVDTAPTAIALRFLTGLFLAGVYPPGMKLMATWFRRGRGMAIGFLVGALTIGKASPYLINGIGSDEWRVNALWVSLAGLAGGLTVLFLVREGPHAPPLAQFDLKQIRAVFENRGLRLANFGYFGHMWELYAMWTWAPAMIRASFAAAGTQSILAELASFLVLGAGAIGCVIAGLIADRAGRTVVTSGALIGSGLCCLTIGLSFGSSPAILLTISIIWGITVVADSAQFSACVTELGDPQYIGTALTLQTCLGFLLTTVSVRLIPMLEDAVGWEYAFLALAPGPAFGLLAMLRLRSLPEASRIAQGRK